MLGLNPLEQEVLDLTNEVARNGFIFFPEFCSIVHRKYREEDQSVFRQIMFKVNNSNKLRMSCAKLSCLLRLI
jgi:Ca2+-binding EF-hand superfamily protein